MECANAVCRRGISQPRYCPVCKKLAYCSQQCRLDHWYAGHQLSCGMEQVQSGSKFRLEDFRDEEQKIRILGKGSYGEVKLVIHIPTGEKYALKVVVCRQINKAQFQKHNSLQVMKREILLHRALDHPHIIKLHDHMEDAENVYLVLELALRGSLFYEIRRHKKLGEEKAREYFRQTCEGVQYLHDHQIIHRDLKPENILLDSSGSLKICDFGWCAKGTETRTTFCGTLDYMAPEMVVGGGHTFSVDLWALGVLLYELVHGTAPFTARKDSEKCQQILGTKFTLDSALSLDLKDLINGLLQADPDDRLSLSQVLSHPWVVGRAKENSLLGARLKKFLHGVGVVEGVVTAVEGDCCTVEYENAAGREQIPATEIARMIKRKKGRLEQGKESEEVSPLPSGSQSPIEEAALLNQIEQWCKAPSQLPLQLSTLKLVKSETNMVAAELEMQPMIHAEPEEEAKGEVMNAHKVRPPSLPAFEMDSDMERGQGEKNGVFSDDVSSDFSNPPVAESRTAADPPKRSDSSKPLFSMSDDQCEPRHTAGFSPMELETFDFEHERQMIEEKNQMFYCETEERWAFRDSQGSVVPAPQLRTRDPQADSGGSNSLIEEIEKLASLTKRGPEDPVIHLQAIEKANEALTLRKNQLEALLKEIEGTPPFPRVRKPMDLRFRDEGKGGFLRWIGSVIGCADRAK